MLQDAVCFYQNICHPNLISVGHIQFDDPTLAYFCDENMISGMENAGVDHEALLDTYILAHNLITKRRPKGLTFSVHMCRGNYKVRRNMSEFW